VTARLQLEEISVQIGGIRALSDVTIDLSAQEIMGVIGPNGAGKTTLFDVISGVRRPTEGRVFYDGQDITRKSSVWRARRGLRRTFQRQQPFGWLTVEENVLVAIENATHHDHREVGHRFVRRTRMRAQVREVQELLELCGIGAVRSQFAARLPIGQLRLVEVARALAGEPRLLLVDEPTSGLTEPEVDSLGAVLKDVCRERNCSVLIVEHDIPFVVELSERTVVLDLGEVVAVGDAEELRSSDPVRARLPWAFGAG
jgi:branched-chain amino acid transport system ATP-binding protein